MHPNTPLQSKRCCFRFVSAKAFSLIEIVVTMTILSILVSFAAPRVMLTMEQSHADIAGANLRAINSAQRFYWLENRTYADSLQLLIDDGLLDDDFLTSIPRYEFSMVAADDATFQAQATRRTINGTGTAVYNGAWQGAFSIDESGAIAGVVNGPPSSLSGNTPQLIPAF